MSHWSDHPDVLRWEPNHPFCFPNYSAVIGFTPGDTMSDINPPEPPIDPIEADWTITRAGSQTKGERFRLRIELVAPYVTPTTDEVATSIIDTVAAATGIELQTADLDRPELPDGEPDLDALGVLREHCLHINLHAFNDPYTPLDLTWAECSLTVVPIKGEPFTIHGETALLDQLLVQAAQRVLIPLVLDGKIDEVD